MRSLAVIGFIVAGLVIPACAQRGGGHGGFSGGHAGGGFSGHVGVASHSAVAFRGSGPARSAPSAPAGVRAFSSARSASPSGSYRPGTSGNRSGRQPYNGHNHNGHRRIYVSPYGYGAAYPYYGYTPWLGGYDPDFSSSSGDSDNSNAQAAPSDSGEGNPEGQGEPYPAADYGQNPGGDYGPPPPYPPAPRAPYPPSESHPAVLAQSEAVTLVFKDGRPPELIHNYLMTRTTIYVQDEHRHSIPVDQLDMAATAKTNQDAGVDFQVPTLPN